MSNENLGLSKEEISLSESGMIKSTSRVTQDVLQQLGVNIDLTGSGRVRVRQTPTLIAEDRRQISSSNILAKIIYDRKLPVTPASRLMFNEGLLMADEENPYIAISIELAKKFNKKGQNSQHTNELQSMASILLFDNLLSIAIENKIVPQEITTNEELTDHFRGNMLRELKKDRNKGVRLLGEEMEDKTSDLGRLSIRGVGADVELCLDGGPIYQVLGRTGEIIGLIRDLVEPKFFSSMASEIPWFIAPAGWRDIQRIAYLGKSARTLSKYQKAYPHWDITGDSKEMLERFISSDFARRGVKQIAIYGGVTSYLSELEEAEAEAGKINISELSSDIGLKENVVEIIPPKTDEKEEFQKPKIGTRKKRPPVIVPPRRFRRTTPRAPIRVPESDKKIDSIVTPKINIVSRPPEEIVFLTPKQEMEKRNREMRAKAKAEMELEDQAFWEGLRLKQEAARGTSQEENKHRRNDSDFNYPRYQGRLRRDAMVVVRALRQAYYEKDGPRQVTAGASVRITESKAKNNTNTSEE